MGMVLIELLTARQPARLSADGMSLSFLLAEVRPYEEGARNRILSMLDTRAFWPRHTAAGLSAFALLAIHDQPSRRPHFIETVSVLHNLLLAGTAAAESAAARAAKEEPISTESASVSPTKRGAAADLGMFAKGSIWLSQKLGGASASKIDTSAVLQGVWAHKKYPNMHEEIRGDQIFGKDGVVTTFVCEGEGLAMHWDGRTFRARLRGDELIWDDGDVWVRKSSDAKSTQSAGRPADSTSTVEDVVRASMDVLAPAAGPRLPSSTGSAGWEARPCSPVPDCPNPQAFVS